ncbi:hypothetical protein [Ferrimonas sp. SCSIO 43195]|uniref:hypothetical protein n=1 Tax=Ferrimonas sp. SCSIO 43195 TaxID=2822844 RepID=UPI0020758624|nr:hypothetical protein [Ferrimonas sp. SCSIO 43195]USD38884.1 hypothetical protein J8Z22_07215 [Ferrimonas sp. SCSIO 43195]
MAQLLPVIPILNHLISVNDFLIAVQQARLPPAISTQPENRTLVTRFEEWQQLLWQAYYEGLLNGQVVAQADEIHNLFSKHIETQQEVVGILCEPDNPVPKVISVVDEVVSYIADGEGLVRQLATIATAIEGADEAEVTRLMALVAQLNDAFDQSEQKLTDSALSMGTTVVATAIDVSVALATEQDPIKPFAKGSTQIAKDTVHEVVLSATAMSLLKQLQSAWAKLDEASLALAQMKMVVAQLQAVIDKQGVTLFALSQVAKEWQQVVDVTTASADSWALGGADAINEWSARMHQVSFSAASQTLSTPQLLAAAPQLLL